MASKSVRLLKEAWENFTKDDCLHVSAALSFYSAFSLAPLLLIAVSIGGAFLGDEAVRGALNHELRQQMGDTGARVIEDMVAHARRPADNVIMSICGAVLLLIGASGVFGQVQKALNKIWSTGTPAVHGWKDFVRNYLVSFSMVLVTGFLLLVSMLLTTALQAFSKHFGEVTGLPVAGWIAGSGMLSAVVTALLFAAIFKIVPNSAIRWADVWVGALFTTVLFMIGKFAIGWYLGREATASAYGSAGALAVVLSWLYYSSIILLFGAEFTETYARREVRRNESVTGERPLNPAAGTARHPHRSPCR
jgi:membrane protein